MFEYQDKNKWSNSIAIHIVIAALLWLPFSLVFFVAAVQTGHLSIYLFAFSFSLILGLLLFNRAQTSLVFPTVEVCDQHLILNPPMTRRTVYNLEHVEGARFFTHFLYFRHNGWPVLAALPRMPKETRAQLLDAIGSAQPSVRELR